MAQEKEIITGNKLIAEFMGLQTKMMNSKLLVSNDNGRSWYGRLYDKDWCTLMAVLEKISTLTNNADVRYEITLKMMNAFDRKGDYYGYACYIVQNQHEIIREVSSKDISTAAWSAVVNFIKSHNIKHHEATRI